jgi:prenyltransferase beta subunit
MNKLQIRNSLIFLLVILISLCFYPLLTTNSVEKNTATQIDDEKTTKLTQQQIQNANIINFSLLKSRLNFMEDKKGGFSYLIEEAKNLPDLYTTYYAMKVNKIFEKSNSTVSEPGNQLSFDSKQLSIMDVFYYCNIFSNNLRGTKMGKDILSFVQKLKNKDGTYSASISSHEEYGGKVDYQSTWTAISIQKLFREDFRFEIESGWVKDNLIAEIKGSEPIPNKVANINTLFEISLFTEQEIHASEYPEIELILTNLESQLKSIDTPISYIDSFVKLNGIVANRDRLNEVEIKNYIERYYKPDGGFSFFINGPSDALATFLAVQLLDKINHEDKHRNGVLNFFGKYKLLSGYYAATVEMKSDIVSTYYAYLISKILHYDISQSISDYLKNHPDEMNHPYYWFLKVNTSKQELSQNERRKLSDLLMSAANVISEKSDLNELITLDTFIQTSIQSGVDITQRAKGKIEKATLLLINFSKKNDEQQIFIKEMCSLILNHIGIVDDNEQLKMNKDIRKSIENIDKLNYDELYYLFYSMRLLNETIPLKNLTINEKNSIYKEVTNCYVGEGLFSYKKNHEIVDLRSTYFGMWLFENIVSPIG